jgi:hypothetical protein
MDVINIRDDPGKQFHDEDEKWKTPNFSKHADHPSDNQYALTDVTRLLWSHNDFDPDTRVSYIRSQKVACCARCMHGQVVHKPKSSRTQQSSRRTVEVAWAATQGKLAGSSRSDAPYPILIGSFDFHQ